MDKDERPLISPEQSASQATQLMMPGDVNNLGHVFGGVLLSLVDRAAAVTAMAVLRSDHKSDEDFRNARQSAAAEIRKHADKLVADGTLPAGTKVSINWHPTTGVPQVSIRS